MRSTPSSTSSARNPLEEPDAAEAAQERVTPAELMVVGDADQSIYAFRGANIRNILDFELDFPDATTILLEQNYRSTQTILSAANAVISPQRRPQAQEPVERGGCRRTHRGLRRGRRARRGPGSWPRRSTGSPTRRWPVPPTWRCSTAPTPSPRVFEEVFIRVGMPYRVVGGVRFYERREVRDALAYLRTLANPDDEVSLRRILNTPKRGIGERAEACVQFFASREQITFWESLRRVDDVPDLATRSRTNIRGFVEVIEELRQMVAAGERIDVVLEATLARSGYLEELEASDDPQDETRVENLAELVAVAREFADDPVAGPSADPAEIAETPPGLSDFLERVALVADSDQIPDQPGEETAGVVTLMTLHTAKGLEFPVVFLTGLEDGVFPHVRALGDKPELEEERRLAYVGLTRARERLYVSRAVVRSAWGAPSHNPASRFVDELPVDLVDWRRTQAEQTMWSRPAAGFGERSSVGARPGDGPQLRDRPVLEHATSLRCRGRPGRRELTGQGRPTDPGAEPRRPGAARQLRARHRDRAGGCWGEVRRLGSTSGPRASSGCCCAMRPWRSSEGSRGARLCHCLRAGCLRAVARGTPRRCTGPRGRRRRGGPRGGRGGRWCCRWTRCCRWSRRR